MGMSNGLGLVLEVIKDLSKSERETVVAEINKLNAPIAHYDRLKQAQEQCSKYSELIQRATGIWPITRRRDTLAVCCKRVLAKLMKDDGFTYYTIGKTMGLNHSTIILHCKEAKVAEEYQSMYPEYNGIKKAVLEEMHKTETETL